MSWFIDDAELYGDFEIGHIRMNDGTTKTVYAENMIRHSHDAIQALTRVMLHSGSEKAKEMVQRAFEQLAVFQEHTPNPEKPNQTHLDVLKERFQEARRQYKKAVVKLCDVIDIRRVAEIDIEMGSDELDDLFGTVHLTFRDDVHPFKVRAKTLERALEIAIEKVTYFLCCLNPDLSTKFGYAPHYVIDDGYNRKRYYGTDKQQLTRWRRDGRYFYAFTSKDEADEFIKKDKFPLYE